MMKRVSKRFETALAIRDAALGKILREGNYEEIKNFGPMLVWPNKPPHRIPLRMSLRTPSQKIPKPSVENRKKAVQHGLSLEDLNLPYGLDIWTSEAKVLNIEWADSGPTEIISFKRGAWEKEVLIWEKS